VNKKLKHKVKRNSPPRKTEALRYTEKTLSSLK
jgi:hypothetical protein